MLKRPIPDLARFRDQCTGIGQTRAASERTGHARSQAVIDCAPVEQRKFAVGYPEPTPEEYSRLHPGTVARQGTLYRGG
jgi:hypothetical protein